MRSRWFGRVAVVIAVFALTAAACGKSDNGSGAGGNTGASGAQCNADIKVNIGRKLTRGLGSGGDWTKGRDAADESRAELTELVKDADMVYVEGRLIPRKVFKEVDVPPGGNAYTWETLPDELNR